jgi:putative membrane protein insertion efficiency factor
MTLKNMEINLELPPFLGRNCRFYPSCSQYAIDAIEKYGIFKGLFKSIIRILKCNPFHPGGYDPA